MDHKKNCNARGIYGFNLYDFSVCVTEVDQERFIDERERSNVKFVAEQVHHFSSINKGETG